MLRNDGKTDFKRAEPPAPKPTSEFTIWHAMWIVIGIIAVVHFIPPVLIGLGGGIALAAAGDKI